MTINELGHLIYKSKNIIVLTGAGISVNSGIPDFRSQLGIFNSLSKNTLGILL